MGDGVKGRRIPAKNYNGDYKNGQRHGHGIETLNRYETACAGRDAPFWQCRAASNRVPLTQEVCEAAGTAERPCRLVNPAEPVYEGEFKDGQYHGQGTLTYEDGGIYEGRFQNGVRHGPGIMNYANGDQFDGRWENDQRRHGAQFYNDAHLDPADRRDPYRGGWIN